MAELIPYGSAATNFTDAGAEFTVAANSSKALYIKGNATGGVPSGVQFELARKVAVNHYTIMRTLDASNIYREGVVGGAGTFAVRRVAGSASGGMDVEG